MNVTNVTNVTNMTQVKNDETGMRNIHGDLVCPNCEDPNASWLTDQERGNYICNGCGMVHEDRIMDESLERRNFADGPNHMRGFYVDPLLGFSDTRTVIGNGRGKMQRIHNNLKNAVTQTFEKNLKMGLSRIQDVCTTLSFNDAVKNDARQFYSDFVKKYGQDRKKAIGERNIDALVLAIIYVVGRKHRLGKNIADISLETYEGYRVSESEIQKYVSLINVTLPNHPILNTISKPHEYVTKYCRDFNADFVLEKIAYRILDKITQPHLSELGREHDYEGKKPSTLAAAAVYFSAVKLVGDGREDKLGDGVNLEDLCVVSGVAKSTIDSTVEKFKITLRLLVQIQKAQKAQKESDQIQQQSFKKRKVDSVIR